MIETDDGRIRPRVRHVTLNSLKYERADARMRENSSRHDFSSLRASRARRSTDPNSHACSRISARTRRIRSRLPETSTELWTHEHHRHREHRDAEARSLRLRVVQYTEHFPLQHRVSPVLHEFRRLSSCGPSLFARRASHAFRKTRFLVASVEPTWNGSIVSRRDESQSHRN